MGMTRAVRASWRSTGAQHFGLVAIGRIEEGGAVQQQDQVRLIERRRDLSVPIGPGDELAIRPRLDHTRVLQGAEVFVELLLQHLILMRIETKIP